MFVVAGTGDSSVLNEVRVPIIRRGLCRQPSVYGTQFTDAMICAGYPEGQKDTCQVSKSSFVITLYLLR